MSPRCSLILAPLKLLKDKKLLRDMAPPGQATIPCPLYRKTELILYRLWPLLSAVPTLFCVGLPDSRSGVLRA